MMKTTQICFTTLVAAFALLPNVDADFAKLQLRREQQSERDDMVQKNARRKQQGFYIEQFITKKEEKKEEKKKSSKGSKSKSSSSKKKEEKIEEFIAVNAEESYGPFTVYDVNCDIVTVDFFLPRPNPKVTIIQKKEEKKEKKSKSSKSKSSRRKQRRVTEMYDNEHTDKYELLHQSSRQLQANDNTLNAILEGLFGDSNARSDSVFDPFNATDDELAFIADVIEAQAEYCENIVLTNPPEVLEQATAVPTDFRPPKLTSPPVAPTTMVPAPVMAPVAPAPISMAPVPPPVTAAPVLLPVPAPVYPTEPMLSTPTVPSEDSTCSTAFVYCPGISTCFTDIPGTDMAPGTWGWSISYTGNIVDDCEIYIGVGEGCDLSGATQVGTFTIAPSLVHYCLDLGVYESNSFQFYTGKCPANDNANHLFSEMECSPIAMATYADRYETYPLIAEGGPMVSTYTFDVADKATGAWTESYEVFPIGSENRVFFSAHVNVCPVANSPALPAPTTYVPPTVPVPAPVVVSPPVTTPTITADHTHECSEAFVFCPGRSKCFNDPTFNGGMVASDMGSNWGWSIFYDASTDGIIENCQIYAGAIDCDFNNAEFMGTFTIAPTFTHYKFNDEYSSSKFYLYAGTCEGNDNGGSCVPSDVAVYAREVQSYPLISETGPPVRDFTFDEGDCPSPSYGDIDVFPITGAKYMTASTCVMKN
jgi:hypothetical protein